MQSRTAQYLIAAMLACPLACGAADASYEHTTQMTGGQFVDMLKNMPMISKQMKSMTDPTSTITMVHGNRKAVVSKDSTEITDLDKEVMIRIDNVKKTYSIMTFAEMRKMLAQMPAQMEQMQQQMKDAQAKAAQAQQPNQLPPNLQYNFSATVTDPGPSKVVNGVNAVQQIVTMKMIVTDTNNPGTNITYTMTTEVWSTQDVPAQMKEVQDFDRRFGEKLMEGVDAKDLMAQWQNMRNNSQAAMAQVFGGKPGAADAYAQMQKELAKIKGTRILEIQRMGGMGTGIQPAPQTAASGSTATPAPAQNPNGGSVAGQVATDTATQSAAGETSKLGVVGSAFGSSVLNAFHRKKSTPPPAAAPAAAPAASTTAPAGAPTEVTLMEMTTQTHNFSSEAIPASVFEIPAGYKQVPSPMAQMSQK